MCFFMFVCLLCALVVSITIASTATIFAVAVAAFLVLSIVRAVAVIAEIVGLEPPTPLPLPAAVLGGNCGRQCRLAAPSTYKSLSISSPSLFRNGGVPPTIAPSSSVVILLLLLVVVVLTPLPPPLSSLLCSQTMQSLLSSSSSLSYSSSTSSGTQSPHPCNNDNGGDRDSHRYAKTKTVMKHPIGSLLQFLFLLTIYNVFLTINVVDVNHRMLHKIILSIMAKRKKAATAKKEDSNAPPPRSQRRRRCRPTLLPLSTSLRPSQQRPSSILCLPPLRQLHQIYSPPFPTLPMSPMMTVPSHPCQGGSIAAF